MKIVKITHYRDNEPEDVDEFVWFESDNISEVEKRASRLINYILPVFEGLQCIAQGIENDIPWKTFSEGLSNNAYWVRVEIRP